MSINVGKKWDANAHYIGRGSPLGNPFVMRDKSLSERNRVCDEYQAWFESKVAEKDPAVMDELRRIFVKARDGHVTLGCFCAPQRCHGDTIKAFIEGYLA